MRNGNPTHLAPILAEASTHRQAEESGHASDDRALAREELQLREALARVIVRRHEHDNPAARAEVILNTLFRARKVAACRYATLTLREHEILDMVLAGRPSKIIAWRLGISRRTIENHRASIMRKTGSKSLPALARFAIAAAWNGANERAVETGDDADTGSGWNSGARQMA